MPNASSPTTPVASDRANRRRRGGGAALVLLLPLLGAPAFFFFVGSGGSSPSATENSKATMMAKAASSIGVQRYKLIEKTRLSHDSFLLQYELPLPTALLGRDPSLPTCIKVDYAPPERLLSAGDEAVLSKSYSPVSHPSSTGTFELIVKAYDYRPGGGVGKFLCDMPVGAAIDAELKKERSMHGSPDVLGRGWKSVGLVGGGTGIAPLLQIARILLEGDAGARVYLLFANHAEEDVLGRSIIDQMAIEHGNRLSVRYALTRQEPDPERDGGGKFLYGRGDVAMARAALPAPSSSGDTMILVCGRDGFVEHWAGPVGRGPDKPDGSKGPKIQGPLLGVLKEAGYTAEQVFKY